MRNKRIKDKFSILRASHPGANITNGVISTEYSPEIVRERLKLLHKSEFWYKEQFHDYQVEQLGKLLKHAGEKVPYYRRLFNEIGFHPQDFKNISDISKFPLLSKDNIKENYEDFIAEGVDEKNCTYMTSGGSTGDPLKIYMDRKYRSRNHANTWYALQVAGYTPGKSRSVRLHGNIIPEECINAGKYWIFEGNRLTMSVYHISEETCEDYMKIIHEHMPDYIHAYPSAISLLAQYAAQQNLKFPDTLKCVFCDSETLYPWQIELLKGMIGATFNTYGHTEGAVCAITYPGSQLLHLLPHVGYTEILKEDGSRATEPGECGEIVVTGFNNLIFPLIRYRTYDIVKIGKRPEGWKRMHQVLEEIQGRIQDYVITSNHRKVAISPALFDYNFDWSEIDRFQVLQEEIGKITFLICLSKKTLISKAEISQKIIKEFGIILGGQFNIDVEIIDSIGHTPRGKYRYIVQKLNI